MSPRYKHCGKISDGYPETKTALCDFVIKNGYCFAKEENVFALAFPAEIFQFLLLIRSRF
jgi:hypothetical protein